MRVLWVGDAIAQTGFARVTHSILRRMADRWSITVMGVNYYGDPHQEPWPIYPAMQAAGQGIEPYGYDKLRKLADLCKPDVIVILNDPWIVNRYLDRLKDLKARKVAYMPVDGKNMKREWAEGLNRLDLAIFYTQFGLDEARAAGYTGQAEVIPHGVDLSIFKPIDRTAARVAMGIADQLKPDAYIIGNVNTNNPRKRLDLTIEYVAEWIRRKKIPDNVYLYLHTDPHPLGWDLPQLARYYGIQDRRIYKDPRYPVAESKMAWIYSALDVQISTTAGEGWGLTQMEGMACGIPQIVPNWAALSEWTRSDNEQPCVRLIECDGIMAHTNNLNTIGGIANKDQFIDALDELYSNQYERKRLAKYGLDLVKSPRFNWDTISDTFDAALRKVISQ